MTQNEMTHSKKRKYSCTACSNAFTSARDLKVHQMIHSGETPKICQLCTKTFKTTAELTTHERTHSKGKKIPVTSVSRHSGTQTT